MALWRALIELVTASKPRVKGRYASDPEFRERRKAETRAQDADHPENFASTRA